MTWIPTQEDSLVFVNDGEGEEAWGEPCDACGWCDRPNECVIAYECPECHAQPGDLCRELRAGGRFTNFHNQRLQLVKEIE